MSHLIEVAFRGNRKEFFRWDNEAPPALKAPIIVEADRGEDLGHVHSTGELAEVRCKGCPHGCGTTPPERLALRIATTDEAGRFRELTAENEDARRRAMERVKANGLVMKLTDAEWQWDRKKLTFYFTADRRVDFRTLVRDLAAMFRTRIELKQIGVRDEAKRLSGIGRCGREYCSASWLPDLRPVNLAVAKDQKLSLNPSQISGACGRLMCCLRYEHEFYVQSRRRFPKEGRILRTSLGEEKVVSCNIFHEQVTLRTAEGDTRVIPLADLRAEMEVQGEAIPIDRTSEYQAIERYSMNDAGIDEMADEVIMSATEEHAVVRLINRHATPQPTPPSVPILPVTSSVSDEAPPTPNVPPGVRVESAAAAEGGEVRRKRRRGRRGGRRLRAAEGRAGAAGEQPSNDPVDQSDDADSDDGGDDEFESNTDNSNDSPAN